MAETLITSSVLIMGICGIRALLKGRISPRLQYGMWVVAALRLIMPWFYPLIGWMRAGWFQPPASTLSVMNAADALRDMAASRPGMGPLVNNLVSGEVTRYPNPVTAAERAAGIDWQFILAVIWVLGGCLLFAWMLWVNLRFSWRLYAGRERYARDTAPVTRLPVYCVKGLDTPCFMAFMGEKAIYLPADMDVDEGKMRHVLIHEDCHRRHGDHIWSALRCILLCCYWINPLVWAAAILSKRDCELACDEAAVMALGEEERISYGRTLLDLTAGKRYTSGFLNISSDLWSGKNAVRERITILARHPRTSGAIACLLVLILAGLGVCTYTGRRESGAVEAAARQWAEAFCGRDGSALYNMYHPDYRGDFYEIQPVQSQPEDGFISFGWSSPWPMDGQYEIHVDGRQTVITYYAMTSDPHRWVWKERLNWERMGESWYVDREQFTEYNAISTADELKEAYGRGIAGTPMDYAYDGMDRTLNEQAKTDPVYRDLLSPERAMEFLLNLHGGNGTVTERDGKTAVIYTFPDGSRAGAAMIQPFGKDGIWIPEEIADAALEADGETQDAEEMEAEKMEAGEMKAEEMETGRTGSGRPEAPSITVQDVTALAGVADTKEFARLVQHFPEPDTVDGADESDAMNWVEHYAFSYDSEPYELQISYEKGSGNLYYAAVQRLDTAEWLNIYRTPEEMKEYGGMKLPDEAGIRTFLDTHTQMEDYLTYRLPKELWEGGYLETLGNNSGGNLFMTSDTAGKNRLEELSQYVDRSAVPQEWQAAGAVQRFTGDWISRRFEKGNLMEIGLPWNHSSILADPVSVADCEAPALLVLVQHDLYTASSLADAEAEHGPIAEDNRTSRMWYIFFAKPDSGEVYSISLNADLYRDTDLLEIARSVHFTDKAWTS